MDTVSVAAHSRRQEQETDRVVEVGDPKHAPAAAEGGVHIGGDRQVCAHQLGAEIPEGAGGGRVGVAGQGTDFVLGGVLEEMLRNGATCDSACSRCRGEGETTRKQTCLGSRWRHTQRSFAVLTW